MHTPLDPAQKSGAFVLAEVMPCAGMDISNEAPYLLLLLFAKFFCVGRQRRTEPGIFHQLYCDFFYGQDHVCKSSGDSSSRHAVVFCLVRMLDHEQSTLFFDRLDSHRAIRPAAREDDTNAFGMTACQAAEEIINRRALPARFFEFRGIDLAVLHHQPPVGRDHIHVIFFRRDQTVHLLDRHRCRSLQEFSQVAFMLRVQVGDDYKSHPRIVWQSFEKRL